MNPVQLQLQAHPIQEMVQRREFGVSWIVQRPCLLEETVANRYMPFSTSDLHAETSMFRAPQLHLTNSRGLGGLLPIVAQKATASGKWVAQTDCRRSYMNGKPIRQAI